jgi:hypothetical protein
MRASTSPQRVAMGENVERAGADADVLGEESLRFKELIESFEILCGRMLLIFGLWAVFRLTKFFRTRTEVKFRKEIIREVGVMLVKVSSRVVF